MSICYCYGRHSTKKQSLTRDVQAARTEAHYRDVLKPDGVRWGGFWYDAATSARKPFSEREYGRQVFAMAQPGDHIVVHKLDRLFRRLLDGAQTIQQLDQRGVTLHALDFPIDQSTAIGKAVRSLILTMAELELELGRERGEAVRQERREKGLPYSKGCPIGWRICGEKPRRYFRVDEQERALVTRMAELYDAGESYESLALWSLRQHGAKRTFPTRDQVAWAINARAAGYPKIGGYKAFRKALRSGEVRLCPT